MRLPRLALPAFLLVLFAATALRGEEDGQGPAPPRRGPAGGQGGGAPAGPLERLRAWDTDGDGRLSRDEFRGPPHAWERLDRDGDGYVTAEEMERGAPRPPAGAPTAPGSPAPPGGARPPPGERGPALRLEHADADRDGRIALGEWVGLFAAADVDADGVLSAEEWALAVSPPSRVEGRAPRVGERAPAVRATALDGSGVVDLARPRRVTVLVFGSWT